MKAVHTVLAPWALSGAIFGLLAAAQAGSVGMRVFWTDKDDGELEVADLDGGNRSTLLSGLVDPRGIVVDSSANTIYWASHQPNGAIYRVDCDGSNLQVVLSGLSDPADLALDRANGVLYWAEEGANRIRRVNLTPPLAPVTVISNLSAPYYIAIDPAAGFLYWSDFNSTIIHRSSIDGGSPGNFITGQSRVRDLALADGLIYWCDRNSSQIRRRAIAGTGAGTVLFTGAADSLDRPHGLVLDPVGGRMFWTDTRTDGINTGAMDGSGAVTSLATTGLTGAWGIALSQPVPTPYEAWLGGIFTAEELDEPTNEAILWGESADPDLDGRINLLEFAQGTSPVQSAQDPDTMQASIVEESGERLLQIVYRIRNDDPELDGVIESSLALNGESWQEDRFIEIPPRAIDPGDPAYEFVTIRSEDLNEATPALFARLRVSR